MKILKKIVELRKIMKLKNTNNVRGANFELAGIYSIRPDFLFSVLPDFKHSNIKPKNFDLYFPNKHFAIEFYSPIREAVPLANLEGTSSDGEVQAILNSAIRYGDAQASTLMTVANTKLTSKNVGLYNGTVLLLIDSSKNDYLDDYFGDGELKIEKIKHDFQYFISQGGNLFATSPKNLVALVEPKWYFFKIIHMLVQTNNAQKDVIKSFFWLSKLKF